MSNIHPSLETLAVPISSIRLHDENARSHGQESIDAIAQSYQEHGQRKPIIVQRDSDVVIAGNGQLLAAQKLGWDQIAVVYVDDDHIKSTRFALQDNRTAELSIWDADQLAKTLQDLSELDDVTSLGWDKNELTMYMELQLSDFDPGSFDDSKEGSDFSPPDNSGKSPHTLQFTKEEWEELQQLTRSDEHPKMNSTRVLAALRKK